MVPLRLRTRSPVAAATCPCCCVLARVILDDVLLANRRLVELLANGETLERAGEVCLVEIEPAQLRAALAVLAGRIGAPGDGAFVRVAALSFEKELDAFAAAQLADGSDVTSHFSSCFPGETGLHGVSRPARFIPEVPERAREALF